ncbi:hypothetical protein D3C75_1215340 [compost metagenome]
MILDETVLDEAPLVVPAEHARVNFEALEQLQLAAEFAPHIADNGYGAVPKCHAKGSAA